MPAISKIDAWRAAELELGTAQETFSRTNLANPDRLFLDDAHVVLLMTRRNALRAMHDALLEARLAVTGPLWSSWHRRLLDYELRIIESTRRAANLESCMGIAMPCGARDLADEAALREERHVLGLYKHGLMALLEHPQDAAHPGCRSNDLRPHDPRREAMLH